MAARRYGRRLRRGAAGTAVAAAAMAALSASQAPGFLPVAHAHSAATQDQAAEGGTGTTTTPPADGGPADGGSPYITDLPPLNTPTGPLAPLAPGTPAVTVPGGAGGLPTTVLNAYLRAQASVQQTSPGCHLPWQLLAAIGQVESGQARGGAVDANGTTYTPILGPVLDGNGFANIPDTDQGRYDGDPLHDRAVGPMQFIPSTWANWGADGNGDGVADPNNVYDAALAAAHYLCAGGHDLSVPAQMDQAILSYNHSPAYLALVKAWYEHFLQGGAVSVPDRPGTAAGPGIPQTPVPAGTGPTPTPATTTPAPGVTQVPGSVGPTTPPNHPLPGTSPSPTRPGTPTGTIPTPPGAGTGTPSGPPTTTPPTTPPTTTPPTTPPTTTPECPTPTPSDSASPSPSPTDTPTATPTPDPCATPTPSGSPTPSPSETGAGATGAALTPSA